MKKFTEKIAEELRKAFQDEKLLDFIKSVKDSDDANGSFEVIASTGAVDRDGESIDPKGWDLKNYLKNPVILWAHAYSQLPIGVARSADMENGKLIVRGKFASHDFAQQVRKLYEEGIIKTVSVGFIVKKRDEKESTKIMEAELLELSFVPVPANPEALSLLKSKGVETLDLRILEFEDKKESKLKDEKEKEINEVLDMMIRLAKIEKAVFVEKDEEDPESEEEKAVRELGTGIKQLQNFDKIIGGVLRVLKKSRNREQQA